MNRILILLASILILFSMKTQAQKRAMTADDLLDMVQLGGAKISPDGSRIIYTKSTLDWKGNKRESHIHSIDPDGKDDYKFLGGKSNSDIKFSPDGKYISLRRAVEKKSQIFLMRTSGGEAIQFSKHASGIRSYKWAPDSKSIIFSSNKEKTKEAQKEKKDGYDHVVVDEGPNGQRAAEWVHLFSIDIESKKEKALLKEDRLIGQFEISPDGKQIAFTSRFENRRNQGNKSEIYLYSLADSSVKKLTDNNAPEGNIAWSPDGQQISFMTGDTKEWELKNAKIWSLDLASNRIFNLSGNFEGNIRGYYWSPDSKSIYFTGLQKTNSHVFKLDPRSREFIQISKGEGMWRIMDVDKERNSILLSYQNAQTPPDLYYSRVLDFHPRKLTHLNPWIKKDIQLAEMEVMQWNSKDGTEIEGVLYKPAEMKEGEKAPFLLHIHGGPAGVFTNSFSPRYHIYAALGYVQLAPNVRGSSGYTDELLRGNMNDIGGGDYEDLMTGVDKLIADGLVDETKMAVRGWSYGGILGGTVVTKTSRFKAASLGAMVSDWTSEYGIGFNYDVKLWYIGGTPWSNPEGYRNKSALSHVSKVSTPVILFHGERDFTDTEAQSMMFFAALKDLGKEVRYLKFPREPHGFREPRHVRTLYVEEIKWIQKHTLGEDWKPWKRKKEKKEESKEKKSE
ncbi:MAG: S9 family peptidase [Bacteroidia bacterium]|nr:S9 family peptidase [Bacteroidia bacterium]